jgi:hypothetical protein
MLRSQVRFQRAHHRRRWSSLVVVIIERSSTKTGCEEAATHELADFIEGTRSRLRSPVEPPTQFAESRIGVKKQMAVAVKDERHTRSVVTSPTGRQLELPLSPR